MSQRAQNFPHLEIPFRWVGSQDSVVSIVAGIGAGESLVRILSRATKYSFVLPLQAIPGSTQTRIQYVPGLSRV